MFLRVGVTKYGKLRSKLMSGNVNTTPQPSRPLSKTVSTPTTEDSLKNINIVIDVHAQ